MIWNYAYFLLNSDIYGTHPEMLKDGHYPFLVNSNYRNKSSKMPTHIIEIFH
jgi:hypothetical protein